MALKKTFLLPLILFLCSFTSLAQRDTLHVVTFVATADATIGRILENSLRDINHWVDDIEHFSSLKVKRHRFVGNDFTLLNMKKFAENFKPNPNDALLFWFIGHGLNDKSRRAKKTPNVILLPNGSTREKEIAENSMNLQSIYDLFSPKCSFVWFIGDACNSDPETIYKSKALVKAQGISINTQESINYDELFLVKNEKRLFYDIIKGKHTYVVEDIGALYSRAFLRQAKMEFSLNGIRNTEEFRNKVLKEYEDLLDGLFGKIQENDTDSQASPGFIKRMVWLLLEGKEGRKLRKAYKKVLEDGNLEELSAVIPRTDSSLEEDPDLMGFLKNRPTVYYMTLGIYLEYTAQSRDQIIKAGECFCTADALLRNGVWVPKEMGALNKIEKYNSKFRDVLKFGGMGRLAWLEAKCNYYKNYLKELKISEEENLSELQKQKREAEAKRDSLEFVKIKNIKEREQLNQVIESNTQIIERTETLWQGESIVEEYIVAKISLSQAERDCQKSMLDKLKNNEPLTKDCEKILASFVKVVRKPNNGKSVNGHRKAQTMGYSLGAYCTDEIKNSTDLYLIPLLNSINRVPKKERSKLKIQLQITGHADAKPCGSGCNFKGFETKSYSYLNDKGEEKSFSTKEGRNQKITNEQLAFSRALCSQLAAKKILNKAGVFDITYEFIANVHSKGGDKYRGVTLSFSLENQFLHYREKIERTEASNIRLQKELVLKERQFEEIERGLVAVEEEISKVTAELLEVNESIFQIDESIINLGPGGIEKNLIRVLRSRGMTTEEAEKWLSEK